MRTFVIKNNQAIGELSLVVLGSLALSLGSQLVIPLAPVPMTLQTFLVVGFGLLFGANRGAAIALLYLLEGAMGFPVFAEFSGGLQVLIGPTGGYLFAFPAAAYVAGLLSRNYLGRALALFSISMVALALIVLCGMLYLSFFVGMHEAFLFGVQPFFLGELIKALALTSAVLLLKSR